MPGTQKTGQNAEQAALQYLKQQGLKPVASNYRWPGGEIDLIMQDKDTLVFIEVRYRSHPNYADALASVDRRKQQRLIRTAKHYLQKHGCQPPCRFDVVGINAQKQCTWVKNAFYAE